MPTAVAALTVLVLASCATNATPQTGTAITRVAIVDLPQEPAHGPELLPQPVPKVEPKDAVAVAVDLVVDGLQEQGLVIIDIGSEPVDISPGSATVRIAATHTSESGDLHTSGYELYLLQDTHDRWISAGFLQLQ